MQIAALKKTHKEESIWTYFTSILNDD